MEGWVKIHRRILEWQWAHKGDMFRTWIYMILKANYKDSLFEEIPIKRGQLIIGLHSLSKQLDLSVQSLRTILSKLQKTGEITIKSTSLFSVITIVKYEFYQGLDEVDQQTINKPTTNEQQAINKPTTNEQQTNNKPSTSDQQHLKKERIEEGKNEKKNIINSIDSGESMDPVIPKKAKKTYTADFESFWRTTSYPKREQDHKGDIAPKYARLRNLGFSEFEILAACDRYAKLNAENAYSIGLRRFMAPETVKQYLTDMAPQSKIQVIDPRSMTLEQRNRQAAQNVIKKMTEEAEKNKLNGDDEEGPALLAERF